MSDTVISLHDVLNAYASGLFPMADNRHEDIFYWYDPPLRGQLSIPALHIPKKLAKTIRHFPYDIRIDTAFTAVIDLCAQKAPDRPQTWINQGIRDIFIALHHAGFAHSVEAWDKQENKLVGGLYGLAIGSAFMGESMFSRADNASKIALVHLCARLWQGGFRILDTQFTNDHLKQFGIYEITRAAYQDALAGCIHESANFSLYGIDEKSLISAYFNHRKADRL